MKRHLHKELFNCPEALWVLPLSLYPFNISYLGPNHALAKCLCPGCWNMDESAHLAILPGCQSEAPLNNTPLPRKPHLCSLHWAQSWLVIERRRRTGKSHKQEHWDKKHTQHICGEDAAFRGWRQLCIRVLLYDKNKC